MAVQSARNNESIVIQAVKCVGVMAVRKRNESSEFDRSWHSVPYFKSSHCPQAKNPSSTTLHVSLHFDNTPSTLEETIKSREIHLVYRRPI